MQEAPRGPSSELLRVVGCFEIRAGWDPVGGGLETATSQASAIIFLRRRARCLPCAAEEPPKPPGGKGSQAAAVAFAGLQIARVTVPQFPRDGGRVYCPVARRPRVRVLHPAWRVLRPDAAGVREAVGAASRRLATGALGVCRI